MTVSALAASLLAAGGSLPAQADPKPGAAPTPATPAVTTFPRPEDPDAPLRAGVEEARKQNKPVEVEAAGTEASRSWANPDGTITMQSYAGPARVKQADGSWAWIDTALVERDGVLKPKVGRADIGFSLGGDGKAFASMERDGKGQRFALDWGKSLPRPEVTGNVARYVDAAGPGADLVLTALPTGFQHDVVLREKPKGPVEFRIPIQQEGLRFAEGKKGGLKLADPKGKTVAQAPEPIMRDSAEPDADGKGSRRTGSIDTQVITENGTSVLVLKPDAKFLADPATKYPVVVDPTSTLTLDTDTYLHSNSTGYDQPGASSLKVGGETWRPSGSTATVVDYNRSLLKFDASPLAGRAIASAQLELWAPNGSRCDVYGDGLKASRLTGAWTPGQVTWANQPATAESGSQIQLCPPYAEGVYPRAFTWSVKDIVSSWAAGTANYGLQIRIASESMTWGTNGTIEFHSAETTGSGAHPPKLTVSYMLPPEIPTVTAESIDSMAGNDAIARSTNVKVGFKSSVAEATNLDYTVSVNDSTMGTPPATPTGEAAYWKFDEASGTTATDSSGKGFPATMNGAASRDTGQLGKALKLVNDGLTDPNDAYAVTTKPVLNTNQSFSVSAWARLDGSTGDHTIVSQIGTKQAGFFLTYHEYEQKWWFGMPRSDAVPTTTTIVASDKPAQINTWTHLVAVYDAATLKLRLYVDGRLSGEKDHATPWNARGNFQIGRTKVDNSFANYLNGAVDDVHVYSRVLTETDVQALHGVPTATSYNGVPSGQIVDKLFTLDNPASFKFVVKACRTGVTPPSCNESPAYRITSDAPFVPTDAETGMADPTRPILSGMVSRPSGGQVTAKYFLYDSTGAPVGSSPLGERVVNGGERASFQIPENTVRLGGTYTWQMQACALEVCTAKTAPVSFTVPGTPTDPPAEDVRHLTLLKDNFVIKTAKTDPTACGGAPCTVTDDTVMRIGGTGTDKIAAVIGFRLDELPDGAVITEGVLKLGASGCPAGTCPTGAVITATPLKSPVTSESKGSDLAGDADPEATPYSLPLAGPQADIAGSEYQWLLLTSNQDEIITFADAAATEQPSLALTYLPAGPPSKVLNLNASGGDASAIASWGVPESNGGMALLDGYDVEVVDDGGTAVKTVQVKDPWAAISGLANGVTYTIKVRAKTAFGVSDWEAATATTKAVPPPPTPNPTRACIPFLDTPPSAVKSVSVSESGAQEYLDRIQAYYQAQDAVLEGRATTIWDAPGVTASAPSAAKLSLLNAALVQEREALAQDGKIRSGSSVQLANTVVQAIADGSVRVAAEVKRTWTETSGSTFSTVPDQSAVGTGGTIEPSEATISIFVFDRCGNVTIIDVPLEANEDSTDHADRGAGGAAIPPPCGAPRAPGCKTTPGERTSCWTADQSLYCEMRQQLGRKNWWLLTSGYAEWGPHEGIGVGCPLECDEFPEHRWKINRFHSFMHVYPANGQKELNTPFGRAFSKVLYSNSTKSGGMEYRSKGCFQKQTIDGQVKGAISLMWEQAGASGEKTVSGQIAEGCTDVLLLKNHDPNNPTKISDATGDVQARCTVPVFGECGIGRYRHHFTAMMWAYFSVKATNPKTGKVSTQNYSVKANHSADCYVSRYRKNPNEVVSRPLKCEPVIQALVAGTLD
ncbi:LamG-like jellyroll fold domain-containing protein [Streptosporangium sp. CA-135522]|uniref:LamG-like jellyroll fold domain-containing protein n=1 Tax=Streptosporangium sp. CA-135522 TaxID=3240072 RepID=UPI003D9200DF